MPRPQVCFAATADFLDLDDSWPLLRAALAATGLDAHVVAWDGSEAEVDWASFDLVVANYTWGYVVARDNFLEWARRVVGVTRLVNPFPHLRWSSEKTYLADLLEAGLPVVPTSFVAPGESWEPPAGAGGYVVKPTVASGGLGAARYLPSDPLDVAHGHVEELHAAGHTVMVQPYQSAVDRTGETALVYFGHRLSHAVRKGALLRPGAGVVPRLWQQEVIAAATPSGAQQALGDAVMAIVVAQLGRAAYGRVDVVDGPDGQPLVLEVELVEPCLFLNHSRDGAGRFATVLEEIIQDGT